MSGEDDEEAQFRAERAAEAEANNPEDTIGGTPPKHILEMIQGSFKGLPPWLFNSMVTSLISMAINKLPRDKKIEAMLYLAELLWPGSTKKTGTP